MRFFTFSFIFFFALFTQAVEVKAQSRSKQMVNLPSKMADDCTPLYTSPKLAKFLMAYAQLQRLQVPLWRNFRTEHGTLVLTDLEQAANCIVVLQNNKIFGRLKMASPIVLENGLLGFYMESKREAFPQELLNYFKKSNIHIATVFSLSLLDNPSVQPQWSLKEYLNLYMHEDFHFRTTFPTDLDVPWKTPWPKWGQMPDRSKLADLCYFNKLGESLFKMEHEAGVQMAKELIVLNNRERALARAREFISLRKMRYHALASVRVPSSYNPNGVTCEEGEAIMELVEGLAMYASDGAMFVLGIFNQNETVASINSYPEEWFYRAGLAQMLFLFRFNGPGIFQVTDRIAHSSSWQKGVFFEFQNLVNSGAMTAGHL